MDVNYELYKVFYHVARSLSFSDAAQELFISQSAVSQSIKVLERRLGQTLFTRSTKKVSLTKEGEIFVNEINDRQQGPTESAGLNNEVYGLPALHRTAFLLNFADLKNEQVSNYLSEVGSCSREIYDQALQIPSPFYIKFISKYNGVAKQDLRAGNYALQKDAFGSWSWNLSTPQPTIEDLPMVDLTQNQTTVHINAVSMNKGDFFPKETQLLRINGVSMPGSAPFSINEEGKSVLSKEWEAPIEALYETVLVPEQTQTVPAEENNVTELQIAAAPAQKKRIAFHPFRKNQILCDML